MNKDSLILITLFIILQFFNEHVPKDKKACGKMCLKVRSLKIFICLTIEKAGEE